MAAENESEAAFQDWAKDLSGYARLRAPIHEQAIEDNLDDLNLRMDEFRHLLEMSQSDTFNCLFKQLPNLAKKYEQMESVFDNIDRLELLVARVKSDLDRLEKCLEEAESTVESEVVDVTGLGGGAASLRSFMPKLFGSKVPLSANQHQQLSASSPNNENAVPNTFSSQDFFPSNKEK